MDGSEPTPGDHGFEFWFSTQNNAIPSHQNPTNFFRNGKKVGPLTGNSSTLLVDEALRFLGAKDPRPFLLFLWFHAPHEPIAVPARMSDLYRNLKETTRREYNGCVTLLDAEIGRLLGFLDEQGMADNTLVFFTSDNGPETLRRYKGAERSHGSAGPLRGMKLHLYEGGYREPAILAWRGKIGPGTSDEPLAGVDLLPTFCDLADAAPPRDRALDGTSWRPLLEGKHLRREKPLYWEYRKAVSKPWTMALRDGPWKLLADSRLESFELYNLAEDLGEKHNRAAAEPERVRAMSAALAKLQREIHAPR
jgi:arylsulfatase A